MPKPRDVSSLSELMSPAALKLLSASGSDLVREIGLDVARGVVLDVLTGRNLRDSTEVLTRRRIAALNLATVNLFLQGSTLSSKFISQLPHLAANILTRQRLVKSERWIAQWVLGLTDKAFQNVLRDNPDALAEYRDRYIETCRQVISGHAQEHGELSGVLKMDAGRKAEINWLWMTTLLYEAGKGVRFDIGFIGRGNPEISLDKVTRFEREISLGRSRWYMATIIIVDRIGANSRLERLAQAVDGTIIQMSAGYWPQQVARELGRVLGFEHELINMKPARIERFLERKLSGAPLEEFIGLSNKEVE